MNQIKNARGHFASLWQQSGQILIPTTETNQKKSRVREREMAKREEICIATEQLTGRPVRRISRSIDGVVRRWSGVRANQPGN
jgi:hypothetical protein